MRPRRGTVKLTVGEPARAGHRGEREPVAGDRQERAGHRRPELAEDPQPEARRAPRAEPRRKAAEAKRHASMRADRRAAEAQRGGDARGAERQRAGCAAAGAQCEDLHSVPRCARRATPPAQKPLQTQSGIKPTGQTGGPERVHKTTVQLEEAGAGAPAGRISHVALETDGEIRVFDVWESQADFEAFGATVIPILTAAGIELNEPMVARVHNEITA